MNEQPQTDRTDEVPEAAASDGPTPDAVETASPPEETLPRARRTAARFVIAFTFGLLAVLTISAGALAAYESSNEGRIMPGVHVGGVDLSGLGPGAAAARLREAYGSFEVGELVIAGAGLEHRVTYSDLGRRVDVDAIVDLAMAIGRDGPVVERIASNVRMFVRGLDIAPIATFETAALQQELRAFAAQVDETPSDGAVVGGETGFIVQPGADGRRADIVAAISSAQLLLMDPKAPASVRVELPTSVVEPDITTTEAEAARDAAERIAVDATLLDGEATWTIPGAAFRGWITFAPTTGGGYGPVLAREGLEAALTAVAADVAVAPVDATFLFDDSKQVVGATSAVDGRALDVQATLDALFGVVQQRVSGLTVSRVAIQVTSLEPELTTAEASEAAPLMKPISEWTTYFPVGINNGNGVNIWIPAREINGRLVQPGEWFDFWDAIGPVTRDRGYRDGGAIIDGRTEPQGALAGGICSCSTTLFNAALRAGLEMGARRNHYYYIDRYPLGLDATVFQSGSGYVQTMSFRNDTDAPVLIQGTGWSVGSKGYVKFVLWSVPTGRDVKFSTPIVKNVLKATDTTVYTTDLAPGVKDRVEYPVDGKDVWVTRTVRDAAGTILHEETYYSHYARITGILNIGAPATPAPTPTPTPAPTPPPATASPT